MEHPDSDREKRSLREQTSLCVQTHGADKTVDICQWCSFSG